MKPIPGQQLLFEVGTPDLRPIDYAPPFQGHSSTSAEAAESIKTAMNALQAKVYWFLQNRGYIGATDAEMQDGLPMTASTQRPRRIELCDQGVVVDSGKTRETKSGRKAVVWCLAEYKRNN